MHQACITLHQHGLTAIHSIMIQQACIALHQHVLTAPRSVMIQRAYVTLHQHVLTAPHSNKILPGTINVGGAEKHGVCCHHTFSLQALTTATCWSHWRLWMGQGNGSILDFSLDTRILHILGKNSYKNIRHSVMLCASAMDNDTLYPTRLT